MSDGPITLTNENFDTEVLQTALPVVVDFWAPWCGPCRAIAPIVTQLAAEFAGVVKVGKLNIDDAEQLASQYRIEAIPALLFFQNGEVVDRVSGLVSQKVLAEKVKSLSDRQVA